MRQAGILTVGFPIELLQPLSSATLAPAYFDRQLQVGRATDPVLAYQDRDRGPHRVFLSGCQRSDSL